MAINKTVNKSTKSHGAMRNCIEYVLKESKTKQELVFVTGPFIAEKITCDTVYNAFLDEKKLWNKDVGRMYAHNIISWHKKENISLEQAFEFGKSFAEKWFKGFQTLISIHRDREHVHVHLVTNTVCYEDGHKLHNTRKDLELMKELTNQMCQEQGLTVAQKGKDFFGEKLAEGHVTAWSKDKYHLMLNRADESYVARCGAAVYKAIKESCSKDEFVTHLKKHGWHVIWKESRKNITFVNDEGKRVRDTNLSKTFNFHITKGELINEFNRNNEYREELERERRNIESDTAIGAGLSEEDWYLAEEESDADRTNPEEGYDDSTVGRDDSISAENDREKRAENRGKSEDNTAERSEDCRTGERGTIEPVEEHKNHRSRGRSR